MSMPATAENRKHWSHTDFKTEINARKRREWELFHALREGSSLPDNVVRVESPEGLHVLEHIRSIHVPLRRQFAASTTSPSSSGSR